MRDIPSVLPALRSSGSFTESVSVGTLDPAESPPAASLCSHSIMHFVSPEQQNAVPFGRRPKLWQLELELHCTVIGTCMPIRELRAIYRRVRGPAAKTLSDYELHHLFVQGADKPQAGIRLVHKYLEKTYQAQVQRFGRATIESELLSLWQEMRDEGEVAGGYWALLTHPKVTPDLVHRAFSDVHMLSHLAGRNAQAEKRRCQTLTRDGNRLRQDLATCTKRLQRLHTERDRTDMELLQCQAQLRTQIERCQQLQQRLDELESNATVPALHKRIHTLEQQLRTSQRADNKRQAQLEEQGAVNTRLSQKLAEQQRDCDGLVRRLEQLLGDGDLSSAESLPNLDGRNILYVGGQIRTRMWYRRLVEQLNGRYLHHDGGKEDGRKRLPVLLQQADVVLCPLDRVSHRAVGEIKVLCQREAKPFMLLRSASLAAFNNALYEIVR